ncbi:DUF1264 domain-containing protein [Candidatus Acetothermia bacterium]|nr:DUF1264 domain-containing protein [Candidatus Acetothermia bacterium]
MDTRLLIIVGFVLLGAVVAFTLIPKSHATANVEPQTWTVLAGMEEEDGVLQALRFLPQKITIHVGDSVTWKLNAKAEEHTVYLTAGGPIPPFEITGTDGRNYFNPVVFFASQTKTYDGTSPISGGVLSNEEGQQSAFTLTFTKPGVYEYVCAFHPGMKGTVTVLPANQKLPMTQADYDQMAQAEAQQALMKAHELHQQTLQPMMASRPDGSTEYTLDLMGDMQAEATALSFGPSSLHIKAGDTLTWKMSDFTELHTVTFPENPEELPEFVMPEPQDNGPPKLVVNPQVEKPAGGDTYDGSGYFNSGYLLRPEGKPAPTYSLTFTKPGTYQYVCLVHSTAGTQGIKGMKGTIVVEPSQSVESQKAQSWTVLTGTDEEDGALQALRFLPEKTAIHVGDSVTWKPDTKSTNEHTIYFTAGGPLPMLEIVGPDGRDYFNPAVFFASEGKAYDGSGPFSGGVLSSEEGQQSTFTLTFTKPGVYEYICAFHPGMKGTITVLPTNQPLPKTQADYDQMARMEAQLALNKTHELHQKLMQPQVTSRPDGSKEYLLELVGDMKTMATILSFVPSPLHIKVGDTVTWRMQDFTELHTVTFPEDPENLPEFALVEPQNNGPPKLVVNAKAEKPEGGSTYAGSGYFNSGFLLREEGKPAPTYSLTFTKPGTYKYVCLVHATIGAGMKGTIVVEARETSAQPQQPTATMPTMATPAQGFTLHIDAKKHINEAPELVVHHYCKTLDPQVTQCLLFDSDAPNAHLIGEETIISSQIYAQLPDVEKMSWHYHKVEIPLVDAKLPGLSEEEAKKVVAAIEDTYGKVVIFWSPMTPAAPIGMPSITKPASH